MTKWELTMWELTKWELTLYALSVRVNANVKGAEASMHHGSDWVRRTSDLHIGGIWLVA